LEIERIHMSVPYFFETRHQSTYVVRLDFTVEALVATGSPLTAGEVMANVSLGVVLSNGVQVFEHILNLTLT